MPAPVTLLDLSEVAQRLRKGRRWLAEFLRDHPTDAHGRPAKSRAVPRLGKGEVEGSIPSRSTTQPVENT